jgi:hypothetical protein
MSTIIRMGIEAQCDALLKERLDCRLADVIGVISSPGGRARSTGQAFVKALRQRQGTPEQ